MKKINNLHKLLMTVLMIAMLAFAFTGCTSGPQKEEKTESNSNNDKSSLEGLKIGFCVTNRDQFQTEQEGIAKELCDSKGIELSVADAKEDISTQISQVSSFVNAGCDLLMINCVDAESIQEIINAAGDVPCVFFNRMPSDHSVFDENHYYVGMSDYDCGYDMGKFMAEWLKDNNKTDTADGVLFLGPLGATNTVSRTDGIKKGLADSGYKVNWVFEDTAEWDRSKAMDKFTQFMGSGKKFDFIAANNDDMALGCIEALTAAGYSAPFDFPIAGIDATENGLLAVGDGTLTATFDQSPSKMTNYCFEIAFAILQDTDMPEEVKDFTWIYKAEMVTADNVDDFK